jgi:hypothetical protein
MSPSVRVTHARIRYRFDAYSMWVSLSDGRVPRIPLTGVPLAWFPRLLQAKPEQLAEVRISAAGCIGRR